MKQTWEIKVPFGQRIRVEFTYLDIEEAKQCAKDSVQFKDDGRSHQEPGFCGHDLPPSFTSQKHTLLVIFKSDNKNVGTGFKLFYRAVSGISILLIYLLKISIAGKNSIFV